MENEELGHKYLKVTWTPAALRNAVWYICQQLLNIFNLGSMDDLENIYVRMEVCNDDKYTNLVKTYSLWFTIEGEGRHSQVAAMDIVAKFLNVYNESILMSGTDASWNYILSIKAENY